MTNPDVKVVFFDGYCNLCNGFVDWLMQVDRLKKLKFSSLQGKTAKILLNRKSIANDYDTVILLKDGQEFERSTAVIYILSELGGLWSFAKLLLIVPIFLRDGIYKIIAKYRFQIFGKRDVCRLPTPEEQERLLP